MITFLTLPDHFWGTVISTLLGVFVGFILNYLRELRKEKKDKRIKKAEIIRKIVSTSKLYEQYAYFLFEFISVSNYLKSRNKFIDEGLLNMKRIPEEIYESWRKDHENYKLKLVEIESNLSEHISEYHTYFGKDDLIDERRDKITILNCGYYHSFDSVEDIKSYSEERISSEIGIELNKKDRIAYLLKELISYVQNLRY
ncbi:MAG TPA: hypothetical protein PLJ52_07065 [Tenuifilaceae bacterium]|nr:hypothetical protein [Tenuifilaceae bacterium]